MGGTPITKIKIRWKKQEGLFPEISPLYIEPDSEQFCLLPEILQRNLCWGGEELRAFSNLTKYLTVVIDLVNNTIIGQLVQNKHLF